MTTSNIQEILLEYNGRLITYEIEQVLKKRLLVDTRGQLIKYFSENGYFLKWENFYNAKGKKLFTPIKYNRRR